MKAATITDYKGFTLETRPADKNTGKERDAYSTVVMKGNEPFAGSFHVGTETKAIEKAKSKIDSKLTVA